MKRVLQFRNLLGMGLVLLSQCASAQWVQQTNGLPVGNTFWGGEAIDACDSNTAVIAIGWFPAGEAYRTVDGGATWVKIGPLSNITDVSIVDASHIWAGDSHGRIFGTTDGGQHWILQYSDSVRSNFIDYVRMFDLNNGVALGDNPNPATGAALVVRTSDGGTHWVSMNDSAFGGASGSVWSQGSFPTPDIGFFFESGVYPQKLFKTTNGGSSWSVTQYPASSCDVMNFFNPTVGLAIAGPAAKNGVYRTVDGGASWEHFSSPHSGWGMDIAFSPEDPSHVWSLDTGRVFSSTDTGRTWTEEFAVKGTGTPRCLAFVDSRHGWLLCNNAVYHTSNGGVPDPEAIDKRENGVPGTFSLSQNYPNPFNPSTVISYQLSVASRVRLVVCDILGREVAKLVDDVKPAGTYHVTWDASRFASGVYFCKLTANASGSSEGGDFVSIRRMLLIK